MNAIETFQEAIQAGDAARVEQLMQGSLSLLFTVLKPLGPGRPLLPLHVAALSGHPEVIERLLAHGAEIGSIDRERRSALHYAASRGRIEAARTLLARGADPDARDLRERTPLHDASEAGWADVAECLIDFGASPLARDLEGIRPLDLAWENGHAATADLLRCYSSRESTTVFGVWAVPMASPLRARR